MPDLPSVRADERERRGVTHPSTRPLKEWEIGFCEWLTSRSAHPSRADQIAKIEELAQRTITPHTLALLKERAAWKEHERLIRVQQAKRVKAKIEGGFERVIDLNNKIVEEMHGMLDDGSPEERDLIVKAAPKYIDPVLARVVPVKNENAVPPAITIHLTAQQQKSLEVPEGEFEVLESESLLDDG